MENIKFQNVNLKSGYWFSKQELNRKTTIDAVYKRFYESKRIEAMDCIKDESRDWQPHIFWDSDIVQLGTCLILHILNDKIIKNGRKMRQKMTFLFVSKIPCQLWQGIFYFTPTY